MLSVLSLLLHLQFLLLETSSSIAMEPNILSKVKFDLKLRKLSTNLCQGVAYQLTEADPLIDTEQCQRDAGMMKTLGANAIRVYHVDPQGDHSGCMTAFANAGIYLIVDLDTFNTAINPVSLNAPPCETMLTSFADHRILEPNSIQCLLQSYGRIRKLQ